MSKVLSLLSENQMLNRLKDASSDQVKDAFFANYFAALLIMRIQDMQGLHLINDHGGAADLTRFKNTMSDVNFWARCLFHSNNPAVKQRMMNGHAELLNTEAGRISDARVKWIVKLPMMNPDQINWDEVVATLVLLKHRFSVNSTHARNLISFLHRWDNFAAGNLKKRAMNEAFMYLLQSDPKSHLLPRMRALSNSVMMNMVNTAVKTFIGFKRLSEEEGGGGEGSSVGEIATGDSQVGGNSIITPPACNVMMSNQYKFDPASSDKKKKKKVVIKDGRIIKKKVKGFRPRKYKLPDHLRAKNNPDVKDTAKTTFKNVKDNT